MGYIDLLPLLLAAIILGGIKPVKGSGSINQEYLSLNTGNVLKGIFAVIVVFHHTAQFTESGLIFPLFEFVGYLAVSVFFFLSGYGLQKSHIKSAIYKNTFIRKRLPKILIPYLGVTILYWMFFAMQGYPCSVKEVFLMLLAGNPIAIYSWYMICICCFYIVFWLFMHICKENYDRMVLWAGFWFVIYTVVCMQLGYGSWWFNTPHLLILGMIWAIHEKKIVNLISQRYGAVSLITIGGLCLTVIAAKYIEDALLLHVQNMISAVLFVLAVVLLSMKVKVENRVLSFLGSISAEIYLTQGLFLFGLRSETLYVGNDLLFGLAVISGSIVLGWILHRFFAWITKPAAAVRKS